MLNIATVAAFVNERQAIYLRKTFLEGKAPPPQYAPVWPLVEARAWTPDHLTDDPVLKATRFTNVFRELDTVTVWIRENIRVSLGASTRSLYWSLRGMDLVVPFATG